MQSKTSTSTNSGVVETARNYYNSQSADHFYFQVWGGEDIHIGLYQSDREPIRPASERTVKRMGELLGAVRPGSRVLDLGAGYGGAARSLAREYGCHVTCLNLSEVQNERNRQVNRKAGLADRIDVVDGSFEDLPFDAESFEFAWSQDAILHSGDREKVFREVDRVLKPGGRFIFTDPMQSAGADPARLDPVLRRIHLSSLGSVEVYRRYAAKLGWQEVLFNELSEQLPRHYQRVHDTLEEREHELAAECGQEYLDRMKQGLQHWINAGRRGDLRWGIMLFEKP